MSAVVISLLVSFVVTGAAIPVLRRFGVLDVSKERSSHSGSVVRGGGVGLLVGLLTGVLSQGFAGTPKMTVVILAVVVMAALGLSDDLLGMPVVPRLLLQLAVAGVVSVVLVDDAALPAAVALVAAIVGTLWLVSYVNAFNFMDGINGISAVTATVVGAWYAWLGHEEGSRTLLVLGLALAGAAMGFLPWNAPVARVFLGDVGSYGVGMLTATLALLAWVDGATLVRSVAPLVVYLADTAWTLVRRAQRGESLTSAHRDHVYQRLVIAGWSHVLVTLVVLAFTLACCLTAVFASGWVSSGLVALVWAALVVAYLGLPRTVANRVTHAGASARSGRRCA